MKCSRAASFDALEGDMTVCVLSRIVEDGRFRG